MYRICSSTVGSPKTIFIFFSYLSFLWLHPASLGNIARCSDSVQNNDDLYVYYSRYYSSYRFCLLWIGSVLKSWLKLWEWSRNLFDLASFGSFWLCYAWNLVTRNSNLYALNFYEASTCILPHCKQDHSDVALTCRIWRWSIIASDVVKGRWSKRKDRSSIFHTCLAW
jgi:hypothetical protein